MFIRLAVAVAVAVMPVACIWVGCAGGGKLFFFISYVLFFNYFSHWKIFFVALAVAAVVCDGWCAQWWQWRAE
jgi:hypothetical protein